jgi:hypothetical protein
LNATDDISGVISTVYQVDSDLDFTKLSPGTSFTVTGEGSHTVRFYSTDRGQNIEAVKSITINIDLTPPEAVIRYDSANHKILVHGTDALSGTYGGAIAPTSVTASIWRAPSADVAETRTYRILDNAGNFLDLTLQVRALENEYELNIVSLLYNSESKREAGGQGIQKNTIQFRRLMPLRCCNASSDTRGGNCCRDGKKCVLAVLQRLILANPGYTKDSKQLSVRAMIEAEWDILHDESNIKVGSLTDGGNSRPDGCGDCDCGCGDCDCGCGGERVADSTNGREGSRVIQRCARVCGLWVLRIKSANGRLTVDTTDLSKAFGPAQMTDELKLFMA